MIKKIFISSLLVVISTSVFASSLQSQISAIAQAENETKAEKQRQHAAQQAKREKAASAERAERERRHREATADKKRDQDYEDELRKLDIEMKKLELEKQAIRVKRENDFIDQELKNQAANTDVIQSKADINRNLSSGGKAWLESEGRSREKQHSGWFK
ncbi:conserved exported hypothetical protein [Xenorhabdus szentirmaii DSM 16338]|uniref:DUF5384 family protein n=1 Tax=Xenorhabdus szentirmaii DSM 16338 TaxID=1427518 RepID=W1IWW1_9GAMM|nr:hypothetical protein Xsze_01431 [Xenorhabdus szentirmaii DSM 16338]CDL82313.1 conserved exported hypothetical protein [Xenorhabdus szentirmaii DSM 16338]